MKQQYIHYFALKRARGVSVSVLVCCVSVLWGIGLRSRTGALFAALIGHFEPLGRMEWYWTLSSGFGQELSLAGETGFSSFGRGLVPVRSVRSFGTTGRIGAGTDLSYANIARKASFVAG